jgi:hypothetical protein
MRKALLLMCIESVFLFGVAQAQQKPCRTSDLLKAENEAVTLRSWDALHKSYRLYARCDDVDAEEGYSESVARILVDHWETLPRLSQLAAKDARFRRFVIGHVDATDDMADVHKIQANATLHCPADLARLCKDLQIQADAAIEEDASTH